MAMVPVEARFAEKVSSGEKRQTIRRWKRIPKVGETLHFWTGPYRPGERRKIGEAKCAGIRRFEIEDGFWLLGDDTTDGDMAVLTDDEMEALAMADGFSSWWEMGLYFERVGLPFQGILIEWGDLEAPES